MSPKYKKGDIIKHVFGSPHEEHLYEVLEIDNGSYRLCYLNNSFQTSYKIESIDSMKSMVHLLAYNSPLWKALS